MWFPRPEDTSAVVSLAAEGSQAAKRVFELLHDPAAKEWRDRVGQAGAANASAKNTVRLLACGDWVFKTDLAAIQNDRNELKRPLSRLVALAQQSSLWHPSKKWLLLRTPDGWLPLTMCRRLTTLRELENFEERLAAWTKMLEKAVSTSVRDGVGLDVNPSNFGLEPGGDGSIFYIDDELYAPLGNLDLAQAIVARIPEEPSAPTDDWRNWGTILQQLLEGRLSTRDDWNDFLVQVEGYPLTSQFQPQRMALLEGIRRGHPLLDRAARKRRRFDHRLTCVFGDVHANLPALESVLAEAKRLGADSFLFLGDAVGYGPHPRECVERLRELKNAVWLRGNHDHAVGVGDFNGGMNRLAREAATWTRDQLDTGARQWLSSLPLEHAGESWLAVHGAPLDPHRFYAYVYELTYRENLKNLRERDIRLCFYGHTHVPFVHRQTEAGEQLKLGVVDCEVLRPGEETLINPGSVGQPRDGVPDAAFALWDRTAMKVSFHRIDYPIDRVAADIRRRGLPDDLANRLEAGR